MISKLLIYADSLLPYLALTVLTWLTYFYTTKCGFVSDDHQGIGEYDGKLQGHEYGMLSRWIRFHLVGGNFPSNHKVDLPNGQKHTIPCGKQPFRHHVLSVLVFNAANLFLYNFLSHLIGAKLALFTLGLFIVHPMGLQGVAWISGLGYPLSLLLMGMNLSLIQWFYSGSRNLTEAMVTTILFIGLQVFAINAQFAAMALCVILAFLGYWPFAVLGAFISLAMGFEIVRKTIKLRADEFKKQNMGASTFIKPRKFIVAMKTFLYYLGLAIWPNKLGLYHKWGFHYDDSVEREDKKFLAGLTILAVLFSLFLLTDIISIKLGILWFVAFSIIFWNWITIQQFIAERYIFIPTLGLCMVVAYLTQDLLPIYTLILGGYLVRTWLHLPTYDNEYRFYQSNVWNFQDSEIAFGNLGVTQMRFGLNGSAMDSFLVGAKINPDYDLPYYNLYSMFKTNAGLDLVNGDYNGWLTKLNQAVNYLDKAVNSKICHYHDLWKKESEEVKKILKDPITSLKAEQDRLTILAEKLERDKASCTDENRIKDIDSSIHDAHVQLYRLNGFLSAQVKNDPPK
jgi:hypothetical protein